MVGNKKNNNKKKYKQFSKNDLQFQQILHAHYFPLFKVEGKKCTTKKQHNCSTSTLLLPNINLTHLSKHTHINIDTISHKL